MDIIFILKLTVVAVFLVMFLRASKVVWGVGLITVTSALLLDTLLGTFGREQIQSELGFFFYVIAGALVGGAALWLWGVLRPLIGADSAVGAEAFAAGTSVAMAMAQPGATERELIAAINERLNPNDVRDLIFDLELSENEVMLPYAPMEQSITRLVTVAAAEGKTDALALAVERTLTPVPAENLPRREMLSTASPPTVLRHFLLAHYSIAQLDDLARSLGIDTEQLETTTKKDFVRALLLYVIHRNRLDELIAAIQDTA